MTGPEPSFQTRHQAASRAFLDALLLALEQPDDPAARQAAVAALDELRAVVGSAAEAPESPEA